MSWAGLHGDHHVHSRFSDDAESTLAENVRAAHAVGLTELRLVDHVRTSTSWVPEFLTAVATLSAADRRASTDDGPPLIIRSGVEAKILDANGRLDLPAGLTTGGRADQVDRVLIADHQYPGPDEPWSPSRVLAERAAGLSDAIVLDTVVHATIRAMRQVEHAQLAHLFSLLPKIGLHEDDLLDDHLIALAGAAVSTGTWVEVNEKWGCPGTRVIRALDQVGVILVAATDSHHCRDVGQYERVAELTEQFTPMPPLSAGPGGPSR
jgi:putative hydrolase